MRTPRMIAIRHEGSPHILDPTDIKLLAALQRDAQLTAQQLGEVLGLSPSQAGRRRQRLESEGYIRAYRADLDPDRLGLRVQGFVQVSIRAQATTGFAELIQTRPEITSAWTMTGEADYLLRVYCEDLPALNRLIHGVLLGHPDVARVQSQIVMDQPKRDAPLPM